MTDFKEEIIKILKPYVEIEESLIEIPPQSDLGDYSVPCFQLAKILKKNPNQIALELSQEIEINNIFNKISNSGPYLNFFVNKTLLIEEYLSEIYIKQEKYGSSKIGEGENIVLDFSSPNIAKPFGIAHIRSTVIGNAIANIFTFLGYNTIRINHLGDWGTQFGKLMVAFNEWGNESLLNDEGINYLVKIYIEFGKKAEKDPELLDKARKWFKDLEKGEPLALELWEKFRELSINEFQKYYNELKIKFDYFHGEAFYNNQLSEILNYLKENIPTEISEGALIVDLNDKGINTPMIIQKSDGASTYHTRDVAAALYRIKHFNPKKILYVVGTTQTLHFKQLFAVLEMLGEDREKFVFINFGTMTFEGEMMSTRRGNFIPLDEVLEKAITMAENIIKEKNPQLKNKDVVAKQVGIGSIIFGDLSNDRINDIEFSWERAINFKGETAPYIQYTHARICSVLRKHNKKINSEIKFDLLSSKIEFKLAKLLGEFPIIVNKSAKEYKTHYITGFLIEVAQTFNKFYTKCNILKEYDDLKNSRLLLAECTRIVLKNGLNLLGIEAPEEM